ncbi:MAG TPA: response regulator transcription factor [Flavisolibacter sp.]|jgi:DNA-binding NarL/FixJ family response regulator|nr:response regulator transcription factor [Flavisolibacter sp.]
MRVLIADDHQLFRFGLISVLKHLEFISEIQEAENGGQALEKMISNSYDVIFMDINMPVMNGTDATRVIKHDFPDVKVIALTMYEDQKHVIEMIESGASGYIIKNTSSTEIKDALLKVMNNELYFSRQISESLITSLVSRHNYKRQQQNELLSNREKEILYLICCEYTSKEIAESLYLSEKTVDWHRLNLLQKTNSKNIAGLVLFALRSGIVDQNVNCQRMQAI